jgi:hypothetical protein
VYGGPGTNANLGAAMRKKYEIEIEGDLCGISWNGFNIYGDKKSQNEIARLIHLESRLQWFEREYKAIVLLHDNRKCDTITSL